MDNQILRCWSCKAELAAGDRFCRHCGAFVTAESTEEAARKKRRTRSGAAVMCFIGLAIVLFAAVHRNPADLILVVAFALPLMGAGAVAWRSV